MFLQIAATLTTPFDVVKTHEQIEFGERVIFAGIIVIFLKFTENFVIMY